MQKITALAALLATTACVAPLETTYSVAEARRTKPPAPLFTITGPSAKAEESGSTCWSITKSGNNSKSSIIGYTTIDGSADETADYIARSGSITFLSYETSKSVCANIVNDTAPEPTEDFSMTITASSNARLSNSTAAAQITDSDTAPAPTPDPVVVANPDRDVDLVIEGDSISTPSYSFAAEGADELGLTKTNLADSGGQIGTGACDTGVNLLCEQDDVIAENAKLVTVLIGRNDMMNSISYPTAQAYVTALFNYIAPIRASGAKVAVATVLPVLSAIDPIVANTTAFNNRRAEVNSLIRAQQGIKYDILVDFDTITTVRDNSFATNVTYMGDGTHPTAAGHELLKPVWKAAVQDFFAQPEPEEPAADPLTGATPIDSNFTVSDGYFPLTTVPADAGVDPVGSFRFICGAGQLLYDDPIVYPGEAGASHLHQFYGNTTADADSTYATLRAAGGSTCNFWGDGTKALNRSAYWMPAMLDGLGNVVRPDYVSIYYKRRPKSDPKCGGLGTVSGAEGLCIDIPHGLKFIFGYDMVTSTPPTGSTYYDCNVGVKFASLDAAAASGLCVPGKRIGAVIKAPSCWNGTDLDSANHRDHMAYARYNNSGQLTCPATHPYQIAGFTLGAWYTIGAGEDVGNWELSSDDHARMTAPSLPDGGSFHADFFMAWDPGILKMWHANCIDGHKNASAGDLCTKLMLRGAAQPVYNGVPSWTHPNRLVPIPPAP